MLQRLLILRKTQFRAYAREGGWLLFGQASSMAGMLFLIHALTERLTPSEYGRLALSLTAATLIGQTVMSVTNGFGRMYPVAIAMGDISGFALATRHMMRKATFVVLCLMVLGSIACFATGRREWLGSLLSSGTFACASGYVSALTAMQNAGRRRMTVALHAAAESWARVLLSLFAISVMGPSHVAVLLGYSLSLALVGLSQAHFLKRQLSDALSETRSDRSRRWQHEIFSFSWPISVFGLFTWIQQSSDRWALERYCSPTEVGEYAVAFQLGFGPLSLMSGLILTALSPVLYALSGEAKDPKRNRRVHSLAWLTVAGILLVTTATFFATTVFHQTVFSVAVAGPYQRASFLLPWLVLAGGIFAAGQVLALKLMSEMRTQEQIPVKVATAIAGAAANIFGAWLMGSEGVALAVLAFASGYFIWMSALAARPPKSEQEADEGAR